MDLSPGAEELWATLRELHVALRAETRSTYGRINPFVEDLFSWKERGSYWVDDDRGITVYNSTAISGDVEIGAETWIGPYCSLDGTAPLRIGHHCSISLGCQLVTHDSVAWAVSGGRAPYDSGPISIGDCTYLGSYTVVLKGVSVGNHCVVGAGSVVTRDVPDSTIAAGVPARPIGTVKISAEGAVTLDYGPGEG